MTVDDGEAPSMIIAATPDDGTRLRQEEMVVCCPYNDTYTTLYLHVLGRSTYGMIYGPKEIFT